MLNPGRSAVGTISSKSCWLNAEPRQTTRLTVGDLNSAPAAT
jgi:hypothetical protein